MTKKKKLLSIFAAIVALLGVLAVVFHFVFFAMPYGRHYCKEKEPVDAVHFLPKPDSILYFSASGDSRVLTEAEAEQIYLAFWELMDKIKYQMVHRHHGDDGRKMILDSNVDCIEFRYNKRQCYIGRSPSRRGNYWPENLEFDAMMLILDHDMVAVPYRSGRYAKKETGHANLTFYSHYYEFKQAVAALGQS